MGYDCTLHVVDPTSIDRFVAWFLGEPADATAFERAFDVAGLREELVAKIASDPRIGGRALLHALMMYCSTEAPHVDARGFCVALWRQLELGFADDVPEELQPRTALEAPLQRLVDAHPALRGYLHTGMTGNYDIGHYVPPPLVPKLRAYVESVLDRLCSDDVAVVEALAGVLRVAEDRGLAYWEATDMPVANGNRAWLEDAARARSRSRRALKPATLRTLDVVGVRTVLHLEASGTVVASSMYAKTVSLVDARTAAVRTLPQLWFSSVACAADGRVFATAFRHGKRGYGCYELDLAGAALREVAVPGISNIEAIVRVGDRVLVLPTRPDMYKNGAKPAWLDGEAFDITEKPEELFAADFGDGTAFANDQTHGYRITGTTVARLASRPHRVNSYPRGPATLVTDDGRLLMVAHAPVVIDDEGVIHEEAQPPARLVTIARTGEIEDVLPEIHAPLCGVPGLDGAFVVWQSDPFEKDVLKVWWPRTREVTSVPPAFLGLERETVSDALAVTSTRELWLQIDRRVIAVPWAELAELLRIPADAFAAEHRIGAAAAARAAHEREWAAIRARPAHAFDDPAVVLLPHRIIEHPTLGRGVITTNAIGAPTYSARFEDGSVHTFANPRWTGDEET
jgi:hypothetical protein